MNWVGQQTVTVQPACWRDILLAGPAGQHLGAPSADFSEVCAAMKTAADKSYSRRPIVFDQELVVYETTGADCRYRRSVQQKLCLPSSPKSLTSQMRKTLAASGTELRRG